MKSNAFLLSIVISCLLISIESILVQDHTLQLMGKNEDITPMDFTKASGGACNDTLLLQCIQQYYFNAGLPAILSQQGSSEFGAAILYVLSNGGTSGYRKLCNAGTLFLQCMGTTYPNCINVPNLINGVGASYADAFGYVSIFKQLAYVCGSGMPSFLPNQQCIMNTYNQSINLINACSYNYLANATMYPQSLCQHEQRYVVCVAKVYAACNPQSQMVGCMQAGVGQVGLLGACNPTCSMPFPVPTTPGPPTTSGPPPINNSPGFQMAAQMFGAAINKSVDPCNDFYHYACGNWLNANPIPSGGNSVSTFGQLALQVRNQTVQALNNYQANQNSARSVNQTITVYNICQNSNPANYDGQEMMAELSVLGTLPILNKYFNPSSITPTVMWQRIGKIMGSYGSQSIVTAGTYLNWGKPTKYVMELDQASTIIPRVYYVANATHYQQIVYNYIYGVAQQLASLSNPAYLPTTAQMKQDAMDMMTLDYQLSMNNVPDTQRRNYSKLYNVMTVQQATSRWQFIDFTHLLNSMASGYVSDMTLVLNQPMILVSPSYYDKLNALMQTPNMRVLQNYVVMRLMLDQAEFIPQFRESFLQFKRDSDIVEATPSVQSSCAGLVTGYLAYTTGRLYIDTHFNQLPSNTRQSLRDMISSVLAAFKVMVAALPWMDDQSKWGAYGKISNLVKNVAYPDFSLDNTLLDAYYPLAHLNVKPTDDLFLVLLKLNRLVTWRQFNRLTQMPDRTSFGSSPAIVNAWYNPEVNSITFPAGILNQPFFTTNFPMSVNYGSMGAVMGHELTHGFDDQGTQFNGTGYLVDWITPQSEVGFKQMAQCVINEYNHFCYPPSRFPTQNCINGVRTQGENIADNGGIKAAYNAYQEWIQQNGAEGRLPAPMSSYNANQLFFLSFAHVWCRNANDNVIQSQMATNPHSPAQYRVIGTLRNFPAFAHAFNCPVNSTMAPQNHCSVW